MTGADEGRQLTPSSFERLPLGAVRPRGWLRRQLEIQADGITGTLDEYWDDLADNAWLGGDNGGWERGPYYADGLVPLAHLLDDEELTEKAAKWVEGFLAAQDEAGWIGPDAVEAGLDPEDPWPRFVVCKVLRQYYEATGDERGVDAIYSFAEYLHDNRDEWSIEEWAAMRWADLAVTLHWLYEERGAEERWLLDLVDTLVERGYDWNDHFREFQFTNKQPLDVTETDRQMATHVVNNAMGVKAPAVRYRQTGEDALADGVRDGIANLAKYHGQVTGTFTGDEHLSGKDPTQGTELCAVVEYMYSLEYLTEALGDAAFGDRLERIAYNALPATFTPDMWAHQYDQQVNQVLATVAERPWTNDADANVFGQTPHFGCCQANFHQGWPKFVATLWMGHGDGLAAVAYGPSEVTTTVGDGTEVTVVEETDYPFDDTVTFRVETDEPASFPLAFRIPEWAGDPSLILPDGASLAPEPGTYAEVEREWESGDAVALDLSPDVEAERRHDGAVALSRGPLVFSLGLEGERKQIGGTPPRADWEYYPTREWNYGLDLEFDDIGGSVTFESAEPGAVPFSPDAPPATLAVDGRRVENWEIENSSAGPVPRSPVRSDAPREELALVPYGATNLRITEFPLLE